MHLNELDGPTGLAVRLHGIVWCYRVVFVRTQGKRNRSELDHLLPSLDVGHFRTLCHMQSTPRLVLFKVPVYSVESWHPVRFHNKSICIEALRDCYESCFLWSFLRFLIQVLGGEQVLVLVLKDKSSTRGIYIGGESKAAAARTTFEDPSFTTIFVPMRVLWGGSTAKGVGRFLPRTK